MSEKRFEEIYSRLPVALQNAACWLYGFREARARFNREFYRRLDELMKSEKWSRSEIEAYQDEKLRDLIRSAYDTVPYYRERMRAGKITPDDIRSRDDLPKLPLLTKEDVRHNTDRLISTDARRRELVWKHTSGTTGKSLQFYVGRASIPFQWAVWRRHRMRFGVAPDTWSANFTGKLVVPPAQTAPPYWRWNHPMQQVIFNMHHMTPEKIGAIVEFLNRHPRRVFAGYPSIIHAFVLTAREAGLSLDSPPEFVFTGAENMLADQREDIHGFTGAVLTDHYGACEGCGNASHCGELVYHEDFEFGILECVDPEPTGEAGRVRGKIVCTGFASPEFPFIRYELGDIGVFEDPHRTCACGRESRVLTAIDGRIDDYVVTPEGRRIMRFDYVFKDAQNVREAQVVQEQLGEIVIKVVRRPSYGARDEREIADEIHRWISPQLLVHFDYVDEIARERSGKFCAVKSLVPR